MRVRRVVVLAEAERVPRVEPVGPGVEPLLGWPHIDGRHAARVWPHGRRASERDAGARLRAVAAGPVCDAAPGRPRRRGAQGRAARGRPHARRSRRSSPPSPVTSAASSSTSRIRVDRARALELAAEADVVVEGWRPGVAARLGVGPDDVRGVNPSVVYCSLSGFGASGPLMNAPGHDVNYQARARVARARRRRACPFTVTACPVRRPCRGLAAAFAICAAWIGRQRTGDGDTIDVSMTDVLASWTGVVGGGALEGCRGRGPRDARVRDLRGRRRVRGTGRDRRAALLGRDVPFARPSTISSGSPCRSRWPGATRSARRITAALAPCARDRRRSRACSRPAHRSHRSSAAPR